MKQFAVLFTLMVLSMHSNAQVLRYYPDNSCKVYKGGVEQTLAWCGGFNNPQFSIGDLNNDGLPDLVVYEKGKGISTFINRGSAGAPDYRFEPIYALNFPPVNNYLVLADYNCDHIPDLFHSGYTGFSAYRGYYNSSNQLCFQSYKDLFYSNDATAGGSANAYNNPGDIPAIVDVDGDGDIDFLSYDIMGGTINYYRNMSRENGRPCDSLDIYLKDRCWGKVYQGFYRAHMLQYSCSNAGLHRSSEGEKKTHSGNTPCLFDWDMDGDMDYLDGSVSFNEMTFLKNGKTAAGIDSMVSQDTMWQSGGTTVSIPTWPAAFNVDIDNDGKKDIVVAPNAGGSENYKCIWFYKNYSSPGVADWRFISDTFLIDKTIDAGTSAYPALFDFDKDGKPDLFVGSAGFRQPSGSLKSRIAYYRNTSTTGSPSLEIQAYNFLNIDTFNFDGAAPCFGDIDNDGIADMIIGHTDGSLTYFKNHAVSNLLSPDFRIGQLNLSDLSGNVINVDGNAAPFIYDIDKDGKPDLVIGNLYGTLQYYRNAATSSGVISLQLINTKLGGVKCDSRQVLGCYSTPFIGRIDNSGRDYLLMGSNSGKLYQYDSIQSGDTTLAYPLLDSQYSYIDSTHLLYNHPGSVLGTYGNHRSSPVVGDIDGDGEYEMIVGQVRGGLRFYKRKLWDNSNVKPELNGIEVNLFPNPTNSSFTISWVNARSSTIYLSIIDIAGRSILAQAVENQFGHIQIDTRNYTSGVYFVTIADGAERKHEKIVVMQ